MDSIQNLISAHIAADSFEFSKHAVDQMTGHGLPVKELDRVLGRKVKFAIQKGKPLEGGLISK